MAKYVVQMSKEGGEPYQILDKTARAMASDEVTAREAAISAVSAQVAYIENDLEQVQNDIYTPSANKFDKKNLLYNKQYVPNSVNPIQESTLYDLSGLIDVTDWDSESAFWFKAYGFQDYSTGYNALVYCFDSNSDYIGRATTSTITDSSFSGEPYRCKVFSFLQNTKYIRIQFYHSIDEFDIGAFYSGDWSPTYIPHQIVPFVTKTEVDELIEERFDTPSRAYSEDDEAINVFRSVNAVGAIQCAFNSVKVDKTAYNTRCKLYSGKFSHDATMVTDESGNGYVAYVCNAVDTGDSPSSINAFVNLAVFDVSTLRLSTSVTNYEVCKFGYEINGLTVISGAGVPNAVLIDNQTVLVLFSAKLSDGNWYMLNREFDTQNKTFGNVQICKLIAGGTEGDFTTEKIDSDVASLTNTNTFISMNAQITKKGGTYYAGVCVSNYIEAGFIVTSTDLKTFTLWTVPQIENSEAVFECSTYIFNNELFYAVRQNTGTEMILCKISLSTKEITELIRINDARARASFFEMDDDLYLAHSINARKVMEIIRIVPERLDASTIIAQCNGRHQYPSFALYGDQLYFVGTGAVAVYAHKFEMDLYNTNKTLSIIEKIIDNYKL